MNVIRTDKPITSRGKNEGRPRENFILPNIPKYRLEGTVAGKRGSSSSRGFKTPKCPRRGGFVSSTFSCLTDSSHRYPTSKGSTGCTSSVTDTAVILAITTGRGDAKGEVGMAAISLRYPHLILCQMSDCQTYVNTLTKIHFFEPIEILMPDTITDLSASRNILRRSISERFPSVELTPISRMHFNEATGFERIRTLCASVYASVELFVRQKYYALAAAAALLKYVEFIQRNVYPPKSLKIEFQGSPNTAVIDLESARSLELVMSQTGQKNVSLLGVMNHCCTPMGRRLLRASILQPPCHVDVILSRQASVAELVSDRSFRTLLQPLIRRLFGADRLLALSTMQILQNNCVPHAEQNLNYILLLKNSLDVIPELRNLLENAENPFFQTVYENLGNPEFHLMEEKIYKVIHPDARSVVGYTSSNMQRCFAIKAGINDLLDIARQTYCELIDDMKTMVESLAQKYKLPLTLGCNAFLGYHIVTILPPNSKMTVADFPSEFTEVRKSKRTFTMTTNLLLTLSQQCNISSQELHLMSNVLLCDLLESLREYVGCLFQLSADVAELDLIASLAQQSSMPGYVKPNFGSELLVEKSTHPVMEMFGHDRPVPNDVHASVSRNLHIITGPNMSGKSTYLKQIVLLQIMAQIGCYVPATKANFRVMNRIFCKLSLRDDIESNASTFVLEVKRAQYMLRSITPRSLIVLDELCNSTTVDEGVSLAWAICERLLIGTAFSFVATHFLYLPNLANLYPNVTNLHFETETVCGSETSNSRLSFTHRLKIGSVTSENSKLTNEYGIALAELSGLPKSLVEKSRTYAVKFSENAMTDYRNASKPAEKEISSYDLVAKIYELIETDQFDRKNINDLFGRVTIISQSEQQMEPTSVVEENEINEHGESTIKNPSECSPTHSNLELNRGSVDADTSVSFSLIQDPCTEDSPAKQREEHPTTSNSNTTENASFHTANMNSLKNSIGSIESLDSMFTVINDVQQEFEKSCATQLNSNFNGNSRNCSFISECAQTSGVMETSKLKHFEYCLSEKDFMPSTLSQDSVLTEVAQINAREKEEQIFSLIKARSKMEQSSLALDLTLDIEALENEMNNSSFIGSNIDTLENSRLCSFVSICARRHGAMVTSTPNVNENFQSEKNFTLSMSTLNNE